MKRLMFTVRDNLAGYYVRPFFCTTEDEAVRDFRASMIELSNQHRLTGGDYVLTIVGTFDDVSGTVEALDKKIVTTSDNVIAEETK